MDYSEKWGKDVEDAVRLALSDLKLERDQVEVIVLEEPSRGFFGIGSKLAKVRVQKIPVSEPTPEPTPKVKESPAVKQEQEIVTEKSIPPIRQSQAQNNQNEIRRNDSQELAKDIQKEKPRKQRNRQRRSKASGYNVNIHERPSDLHEIEDAPALDFLKEVTVRMGLNLSIKAFANDSSLYFDISGPDAGTIIGKRGQTLDSIQYLTSLVANKGKEKYQRVIVDAENYRAKRERTLEQLANRLADKVTKTGKSVRLEPMNPYERKVIHAFLQKNPSVTTRSEGEDPYRRVIIEKK